MKVYFTHVLVLLFADMITISLTSSPTHVLAGDTVTLTCSVTLPTGVTGIPDFQWEGPGVTPTPADSATSGQIVSSDLTLSEIATSQAGLYSCVAYISGTIINTSITILIQSKFTKSCVCYNYVY